MLVIVHEALKDCDCRSVVDSEQIVKTVAVTTVSTLEAQQITHLRTCHPSQSNCFVGVARDQLLHEILLLGSQSVILPQLLHLVDCNPVTGDLSP